MSVLSNNYLLLLNNNTIDNLLCKYKVTSNGQTTFTQNNKNLDHVFDSITEIDEYALYFGFNTCAGITGSISFPELTIVNPYGLAYAFSGCTGITGVSFPELTTVGKNGLDHAFSGCTGITGSLSFPELTTVGENGLDNLFYGCTGITELHFKADSQSVIKNSTSYSSRFGASNATIYFDL